MTESLTIINDDVMRGLAMLPDDSIHCCVTSPPYWGLRDYGVAGQIGLEPTPEGFVARMVEVFREVRRVLRRDGVCWVNLGDSYSRQAGDDSTKKTDSCLRAGRTGRSSLLFKAGNNAPPPGLKPKDLVGIPWRVALALQADGWWLRQDIIWHKPNPMPESVTDRCTKAHEYVFLLTRAERYWWDQKAIRQPHQTAGDYVSDDNKMGTWATGDEMNGWQGMGKAARAAGKFPRLLHPDGSNRRSVWTIPTQPTPDAHFATFPEELPRLCILASCPLGGTVLDPFAGSGTTGKVALELGRRAVLIELNPEYVKLIEKRTNVTPGML